MQGLFTQQELINPTEVVEEVLVQSRPLLETNHVTALVEGVPVPFYGDQGLIKVVVRNILTNAIRHGARPGQVTLLYLSNDSEAGIAVQDQGQGMPLELVTRLTETQSEKILPTRAMLSLGGLGLVFLKDFVNRQQGRIHVTATKSGTRVEVWFKRTQVA
jgi:two-component system CheB/CheR fusion protein